MFDNIDLIDAEQVKAARLLFAANHASGREAFAAGMLAVGTTAHGRPGVLSRPAHDFLLASWVQRNRTNPDASAYESQVMALRTRCDD